jgi:hypothetical protein
MKSERNDTSPYGQRGSRGGILILSMPVCGTKHIQASLEEWFHSATRPLGAPE